MARRRPPAKGDGRVTIAQKLGEFAAGAALSQRARETVRLLMLDISGLCVAARRFDYIEAALSSAIAKGDTTAIGHAEGFAPYDAALINGTAAHGEDYDDTFEGGPVHAGAVI